MNKFYLKILLLVVLTSSSYSQSGWFWQNPLPQGNDLQSVKFINSETGFCAGSLGTVIKTTNFGMNWVFINEYEQVIYRSIYPLNKDTIFICGDSGIVKRTFNGGDNWQYLNTGVTNHINK